MARYHEIDDDTLELLDALLELLDKYADADCIEGEYMPNRAMQLQRPLQNLIERLRESS